MDITEFEIDLELESLDLAELGWRFEGKGATMREATGDWGRPWSNRLGNQVHLGNVTFKIPVRQLHGIVKQVCD